MKIKIAFFVLLSLGLSGCSHLFYFPSTHLYTKPHKLEIPPDQRMIASGDDQISIWHFKVPGKKPKAKILFFHGNAENVSTHFMALNWILKHDIEFAIFDYPGYGSSTGKPSQKTTTDAGRAVLSWYAEQSPDVPLVIFGQSLGGNIALYVAEHEKNIPRCLVAVESTFESYRTVARRTMSKHWLTWLLQPLAYSLVSNSYSAKGGLDKISPTPLLVIHGDADPIVGFKNGEEIYEAALPPKEFWKVSGGGHISTFFGPDKDTWRQKFVKYIEERCHKKSSL